MNEIELENELIALLDYAGVDDTISESLEGNSQISFEDAGVLTHNRGFIMKLQDGSEFHITIYQSKESK